VFCKLRGNPYVELVHWLHQILQAQDSDLHRIDTTLRNRRVAKLAADLTAALDKLPEAPPRFRISRRRSKSRSSAAGCTPR
jgi:ATP-dependent Clp protease ATP-binding subunit ClpA